MRDQSDAFIYAEISSRALRPGDFLPVGWRHSDRSSRRRRGHVQIAGVEEAWSAARRHVHGRGSGGSGCLAAPAACQGGLPVFLIDIKCGNQVF